MLFLTFYQTLKEIAMTPYSSVFVRLALASGLLLATASHAQLSVEEVISGGVLNPTDTSWHYYLDQMKRFPDRLGFICVNGYELDKTGDHVGGLAFLSECSRRGNAPSMVYLADMLEAGRGSDLGADPAAATQWLRRAAESGYAVAQFHLGVALLLGRGVEADGAEAEHWLRRAAAQGDADALALIRANFDRRLAANARPVYD
jgi:TPR repeat protein